MDDPLLVGVLHRLADLHEQLQPLRGCVSCCLSQYSVIGTPLTSSITKYGRPASVAPASKTRAMLGWSIIASACRSASKRATTWRVSIPSLMIFSARLPPDRLLLLGQVDAAEPAFADQLQQRVLPDLLARGFGRRLTRERQRR